jgi:hypothetical protein
MIAMTVRQNRKYHSSAVSLSQNAKPPFHLLGLRRKLIQSVTENPGRHAPKAMLMAAFHTVS